MYNTFSLGVIKCDDRLFLDMHYNLPQISLPGSDLLTIHYFTVKIIHHCSMHNEHLNYDAKLLSFTLF